MKKTMVFVLVMALAMGLLSGFALAEGTRVTSIGSGQVTINPDQAMLNLGVSETNPDVVKAMESVNQKLAAVRAALSEAGVDKSDVMVNDIYMYTQYNYEVSSESPSGYSVSHQLSVTVRDLENLGRIIDAAVSAGANQLNGVSFMVADRQAAYEQALKLAVDNAKARAETMALAAGLTLGELSDLTESEQGGGYVVAKAVAEDAAAGGGTQVDVGTLTVTASVTAIYETK